MKKNLNILFFIVLLISLGFNSYAQDQDLPLSCGGSIERYWVGGDNGNSTFQWDFQGGEIVNSSLNGDTVDIKWYAIEGIRLITVTETNIYGCYGEFTDTVMVYAPSVSLSLDEEICQNESYDFVASGSDVTEYLWQDDVSTGDIFIATTQGDYWVRVTDEYGCRDTDSAYLTVHDLPIVDLGNDTTLCGADETIEFDISDISGINNYEWPDVSNNSPFYTVYTRTEDQEIWVHITNDYGCIGSDTVMVNFCGEFKIPNAFTPNEDGYNDKWEIPHIYVFPDVTIDVYNRWGERIFHSDGYSAEQYWDGTNMNGKKLPMDTYYYVIDLHNDEAPMVGTITIIR